MLTFKSASQFSKKVGRIEKNWKQKSSKNHNDQPVRIRRRGGGECPEWVVQEGCVCKAKPRATRLHLCLPPPHSIDIMA